MSKEPMKNRVIRVSDETWDAAMRQADRNGEALSEVIRDYLDSYAGIPAHKRISTMVLVPPGTDDADVKRMFGDALDRIEAEALGDGYMPHGQAFLQQGHITEPPDLADFKAFKISKSTRRLKGES